MHSAWRDPASRAPYCFPADHVRFDCRLRRNLHQYGDVSVHHPLPDRGERHPFDFPAFRRQRRGYREHHTRLHLERQCGHIVDQAQ
jgi:hypothetical protein